MRRPRRLWIGLLCALCLRAGGERVAFVTFASDGAQAKAASILLRSLRRHGGALSAAPFHVVQPAGSAPVPGGQTLALPPPDRAFPFLAKVEALAEAEARLKGRFRTLVYLDAETLVLGEPRGLVPGEGKSVAIRPVHLANQVGLPAEGPLDAYWTAIYAELGGPAWPHPPVRTLADDRLLHPYFSCVAFGFDPSLGLMARWRTAFRALLDREAFRQADARHRIFLHQAVLSALLAREFPPDRIQNPEPHASYPMALHTRLPEARRIRSLEEASCLYVDTLWRTERDWWKALPCGAPLRAFLETAQLDFHRLDGGGPHGLYWEEGPSNAYLVQTPGGDVLIDPAGAAAPHGLLRRLPGPLRAIVLTHTHTDHTRGTSTWHRPGLPLIAQEEWRDFRDYHARLQGFFERRDGLQGNVLKPMEGDPAPTRSFRDRLVFRVGGRRFEAFHAPGETPDHLLLWVPHLKAVFVGDNLLDAFPNLAPPRGSLPRWPLAWIRSLDRILSLEPEILCAGHMEPLVGRARIREAVTRFRDAIRFVHDETVKGMNEGKPLARLAREIRLPGPLALPESYARVSWAVRGIYLAYGGWFDENPASLADPGDVSGDVASLCGTEALLQRAQAHLDGGRPREALGLLELLLKACPQESRALEMRQRLLKLLAEESPCYLERKWLRPREPAAP